MKKTLLLGLIIARALSVLPVALGQVVTSQYDNARSGANTNETILTPQNVNATQFGKIFSFPVDGAVYGQPLYLPDVEIPGKGRHNVVFVVTEHDSVYAFDADGDSTAPLWQVSFTNRIKGVTSIPSKDLVRPCISPEVGITSTPAIAYDTGTLYLVARTKERSGLFDSEYVQQLHALAVTTGAEKFGGPVVIKASVPGNGAESVGGKVEFNTLRQNQRAALLLDHGTIYLAWASHCGAGPYHGWVMAYDAATLAQKGVFNSTPDAVGGGIWMGGRGPAADPDGNVFVATGNGKFDGANNGRDYADSVLKLGLTPQGFSLLDYFTPYNQEELETNDEDVGSGGPVLLAERPGRPGTPAQHLLTVAGKGGTLYLLDRDHLGKFQPGSDRHAVDTIPTNFRAFGAGATWNGNIYYLFYNDVLRSYAVERGKLVLKSTAPGAKFKNSGASPSVSANGSKNGIVWVVEWRGWRPEEPAPVLHAYDAANVATELYNSEQNGGRDRLSRTPNFAVLTAARGRVYVGGVRSIDVYGLLPAAKK